MNYFLAPMLTLALFAVCFLFSVFLRLSLPQKRTDKPEKTVAKRPRSSQKVYLLADLKPVPPIMQAEREVIPVKEKQYIK